MSQHAEGAYTGEISAEMLLDVGCDWVVLGHSERRTYYGETDQGVNAKAKVALERGLTPIICVGETLEQREAGETDALIRTQTLAAVQGIDPKQYSKLVFAYEPVWAIGTGKVCESPEANRVCALIRSILAESGDASQTRILYGGSVKPDNAQELLNQSDIDGALVGGASLTVAQFWPIIQAGMTPATQTVGV
jgi:triosephosphate isomerase